MVEKIVTGIIGGKAQTAAQDYMQSTISLHQGKAYVKLTSLTVQISTPLIQSTGIQFQITSESKAAIALPTDVDQKWFRELHLPAGSLQSIANFNYSLRGTPGFSTEDNIYLAYDTTLAGTTYTAYFKLIFDVSPARY